MKKQDLFELMSTHSLVYTIDGEVVPLLPNTCMVNEEQLWVKKKEYENNSCDMFLLEYIEDDGYKACLMDYNIYEICELFKDLEESKFAYKYTNVKRVLKYKTKSMETQIEEVLSLPYIDDVKFQAKKNKNHKSINIVSFEYYPISEFVHFSICYDENDKLYVQIIDAKGIVYYRKNFNKQNYINGCKMVLEMFTSGEDSE